MVLRANARVQPWAMVVKVQHTFVACPTMLDVHRHERLCQHAPGQKSYRKPPCDTASATLFQSCVKGNRSLCTAAFETKSSSFRTVVCV
eukprot:4229838-Amphidinium_carterae.2